MACAPHTKAVDNMLGFLRYKQAIDSDNRVLDRKAVDFYRERSFIPQLRRENIPGDPFTISKGILVPNYDVLEKMDRFSVHAKTGDVAVAEASYSHYKESVDLTPTWQEGMQEQLETLGFSPEEQRYIREMAEAGMIPLSCK